MHEQDAVRWCAAQHGNKPTPDLPVYQITCPVQTGTQNSYDEPPNVGVSRAAGDGRDEESWRHELALQSRAQVTGCASSVGCTRCWAGGARRPMAPLGYDPRYGCIKPHMVIDAGAEIPHRQEL